MTDEYIRKQDAVDTINENADSLEQNGAIPYAQGARTMAVVVEHMLPAENVVPICQTGCKGCKREYNLVVGSCRLCARFYEDMYEGIK